MQGSFGCWRLHICQLSVHEEKALKKNNKAFLKVFAFNSHKDSIESRQKEEAEKKAIE